jgi:Spy/CpxP family protein refolding chaperone
MKRFHSVIVITLFTALVAGGAAFAQGFGGRGRGPDGFGGLGGRGGPGGFGLPLQQIELSETQRQQIRDVTQQYRDQNRQAVDQLRAATEAQRKAVETMPLNEGLIRSTTQALADAQTELAIQRARMQGDILALLTPAQQDQLKKVQADREARLQQQRERKAQRPAPQQ